MHRHRGGGPGQRHAGHQLRGAGRSWSGSNNLRRGPPNQELARQHFPGTQVDQDEAESRAYRFSAAEQSDGILVWDFKQMLRSTAMQYCILL